MRDRVGLLHELCREAGREPSALRVAVALSQPAEREELAAAGVDELVLVEGPPEDPADAAAWAAGLAAG